MSIRTIHRSQLASRSSKIPLSLKPTIDRASHGHTLQLRMLWWCHHTRDWQANHDEYLAEGIKRHEKIMRHKYSKALRRRALWENDEVPRWSWRVTKYLASKHQAKQSLSTSQQDRNPPSQHQEPAPAPASKGENEWFKPKDFDSFKAYFDRQVARHPYGALFGRKLHSPPSTNNSSWTSFSWILTPGRGDQQSPESGLRDNTQPSASRPIQPSTSSSSSTAPDKRPIPATTVSDSLDDYEYDPITMRKVPKLKATPDTASSKPFLESLFSEHGVDVPVKTYKPHKVFGYGSNEKPAPPAGDAVHTSPERCFGSSRKSELEDLMSRAKGNNIDTTALYTEALPESQTQVKSDTTTEPSKHSRASPEPDSDAPLFSGTTYQDRARLDPDSQPMSSWLINEGFESEDTSSPEASSSENGPKSKLTPALDRIQSELAQSTDKEPARLQPSLDRYASSSAKRSTASEADARQYQTLKIDSENLEEQDIDLLRASDVRAATKSARLTKQDIDQSKQSTRVKLEASFKDQQAESEAIAAQVPRPAGKLSQGLNNAWNHIRQYPSGIVAKTINSIPALKENFQKSERVSQASDLNEKLVFNQDALNRTPSIYKPVRPSNLRTFTPSKEYEKATLESSSRTESLKAAAQKAKQEAEDTNKQLLKLAADIKAVYEAEYGPITSRHRQVSSPASISPKVSNNSGIDKTTESKTSHPLSTASVKPGVVTNSIIDKHINDFEPRYATLVDEMKKSKADIQALEGQITSIKSQKSTIERPTEVPPPIFTAPGSSVWNDEQPPPIETLRTLSFTSPFVVLKYDAQTAQVVATETRSGSKFDGVAPIDPIKALARLDNASSYLPHFSNLARSGYELCHGGSKVLVFRKKATKPSPSASKTTATVTNSPALQTPLSDRSSQVGPSQAKVAATVLDEIPTEVVPPPGPAAPTAPSASKYNNVVNSPQVRRQEDVFSGTMRSPRDGSSRFNPPSSSSRQTQEDPEPETDRDPAVSTQNTSSFAFRARRALRTLIIWTSALSIGAYVVGVAAEGIGAQSQAQMGVHDSNALGPRKRVVLPAQQAERQRPGIFSTESSR
ncbi:hypothetical protein PV10_07378 [Exophiala mesophila]|uniref:Uncharacterized protein n=1 Tax=Exophiala mesophila TaxID=212818 RepID=A0A0D1Z5G5_EXOME|nr:uncharacterized protein PV10_07378 [Exophiala mesophila]KIV90032.1 hypothetical protein PV10_07378 [Exophiala mesophila]